MATWKEIGVVLDSDDEDLEDSQSIGSNGGAYDEDDFEPVTSRVQRAHEQAALQHIGNAKLPSVPLEDKLQTVCIPHIEGSPSSPPMRFKVPLVPDDLRDNQELPQGRIRTPDGTKDEISTSYITVSSPLSSLPDSTPKSPSPDMTSRHGSSTPKSKSDISEGLEAGVLVDGSKDTTVEDQDDIFLTESRVFRDRLPIQLRPYALEGMLYEKRMKSRGVQPVKVSQGYEYPRQENRLKRYPDSDLNSPVDRQNEGGDWEFGFSSAASSQPSAPEILSRSPRLLAARDFIVQEDEVPHAKSLARVSFKNFGRQKQMRQMTDRSDPLSSKTASTRHDIFDMPASPPTTSPPIPRFREARVIREKRTSESPSGPSRETSVERYVSRSKSTPTGTLPTPATSAVKEMVDVMMIESDEDSSSVSEPAREPESLDRPQNQSLQVHRKGKDMRGVLPASWARLDAHKRQVPHPKPVRVRVSQGISPVEPQHLARKGVAVPRIPSDNALVEGKAPAPTMYFISDDESDESDPFEQRVGSNDHNLILSLETDDALSYLETASAVEDDYIDTMVPGQKRRAQLRLGRPKKKRRTARPTFRPVHDGPSHQPRITDHLSTDPSKSSRYEIETLSHNQADDSSRTKKFRNRRPKKPFRAAPPALSILDVIDPNDSFEQLPQFIRIAARSARSRKEFGRHSPSRKFIRLGDREETQEAQVVLQRWREGKIGPRNDLQASKPSAQSPPRLNIMSGSDLNQRDNSPRKKRVDRPSIHTLPRKRLINKARQTRIDWTQTSRDLTSHLAASESPIQSRRSTATKPRLLAPVYPFSARQAQLETSASEQTLRHPNLAFVSTKKVLDAVYRKGHRGTKIRGDVQLARFMGDDDILARNSQPNNTLDSGKPNPASTVIAPSKAVRRRKQPPKRLDAGAAKYRQPSEPLILDLLQSNPDVYQLDEVEGKLTGLGTYGSTYTYHFDLSPIMNRVFFHESTFIGSGRLSKAIQTNTAPIFGVEDHGHMVFMLAEKRHRWGPWDDVVSSELGLCFDWAIEQLHLCCMPDSSYIGSSLLDFLTTLFDYVNGFLSFQDNDIRLKSMCRFVALLNTMTDCLEVLRSRIDSGNERSYGKVTEAASVVLVLVLRLIRGFGSDPSGAALKSKLEDILQRIAVTLIKFLAVVGLEPVRKLYDDLQYLEFREQGIKANNFAAQAWVILMHVLDEVKIPQASFWDLVNAEANIDEVSLSNDARLFEKLWYFMFSVLPLCEFDHSGIVVSGSRCIKSSENWALPQKIFRRIFELYSSGSRQSPSFNQYCAALFRRCHHLIEVWGWGKHGTIIGTLFDFFALHKLAHLRNEEAYGSPHFLEHLDKNPSLAVEQDDHCFHIFLKIVAISLRQLSKAANTKAIRNLVTRVTPNHDRQYPRENAVHQRDLASLRNHHDLLCTLFWAAPSDNRPSLNLIRSLVQPSDCHREAYIIHLSAWSNLAAFSLSCTPVYDSYKPFAEWEKNLFSQLVQQYNSVDADVEFQLRRLSSSEKHRISQTYIQKVAERNKEAAVMLLIDHLTVVFERLKSTQTMDQASAVFQNLISHIGGQEHFYESYLKSSPSVEGCFESSERTQVAAIVVEIVRFYIHKLDTLFPYLPTSEDEDDSQGYGDTDTMTLLRLEYASVIDKKVIDCCCYAVRCATFGKYHPVSGNSIVRSVIDSWIHIVVMLSFDAWDYNFSDFTSGGKFAVFDLKDDSRIMRLWTMTFQIRLIEVYGEVSILTTGQDPMFGALYLLCLPKVPDMKREGYQLLQHYLMYPLISVLPIRPISRSEGNNWSTIGEASPTAAFGDLRLRLHYIGEIFRKMYAHMSSAFYPTETAALRDRFSHVIDDLQIAMKREAMDLPPSSKVSAEYNDFLWNVSRLMEIHFNFASSAALSNYFLQPGHAFDSDDKVDFRLRVYAEHATTPRGVKELNFFCLALVTSMASDEDPEALTKVLLKAMQPDGTATVSFPGHGDMHMFKYQSPFEEILLTQLVPSFVHVAFVNEKGFYAARHFLQTAAEQLKRIANRGDEGLALRYALPILRTITHGLSSLVRGCVDWEEGMPPERPHMRIFTTITVFYTETFSLLWLLAKRDVGYKEEVLTHLQLCKEFTKSVHLYFSTPQLRYYLTTKKIIHPCLNQFQIIDRYCSLAWQPLANATTAYFQAFTALANLYVDITDHLAVLSFHHMLDQEHGYLLYHHLLTAVGTMSPEMQAEFNGIERSPKCPPFAVNILEDIEKNWRWASSDEMSEWAAIQFNQSRLHLRQGKDWVTVWTRNRDGRYNVLPANIQRLCAGLLKKYERLTKEPYENRVALKNHIILTLGLTEKNGRVRAGADYKPRDLTVGIGSQCLSRYLEQKPNLMRMVEEYEADEDEDEFE